MLLLALSACILTSQEEYDDLLEHSMDHDDDGHRAPEFGGDDCDDDNATVFPGAYELCDYIDQDCDEWVDEGYDKRWYQDLDRDGHYGDDVSIGCMPPDTLSRHEIGEDCDDRSSSAFPGAEEVCDGTDNDCDGTVDEGGDIGAETYYMDLDGDGYGDPDNPIEACFLPAGAVEDATDCDDTEATVHPGHEEICNDHLDNDCDGTYNQCRRTGVLSPEDADVILYGPDALGVMGIAACGVGDLDGDGVAELALGAPSLGGTSRVYVLASPLDATATPEAASAIIEGESSGCLGFAISWSPDVTGDGSADLVLGDPCLEETSATDDDGSVYWLTAPIGDITLADDDRLIRGQSQGWEVGQSVSATGDADGDGRMDLLVGAPLSDHRSTDGGSGFYFYGPVSAGSSITRGVELYGISVNQKLGEVVAFVGDLNGDGYDDVGLGSPNYDNEEGVFYIEPGPIRQDDSAGGSLTLSGYGSNTGERRGASMAPAGDVNGEGYDDALVGAPGADEHWNERSGSVLLIEGGSVSSLNQLDRVELTGQDDDHAGWSVAGAGDFDGDGYDDILIGAPNDGEDSDDNTGRAYLVYGPVQRDMSLADADLILQGEVANDFLGASVCGDHDLNGDGYPDLVIGAPADSTNGSAAGAVYVLFGRGL